MATYYNGKAHKVDLVVGGNLSALRKAAGVSSQKMAYELGISYQQLKNYECGRTRITEATIIAAAGILNVPVAALFAQGAANGKTTER